MGCSQATTWRGGVPAAAMPEGRAAAIVAVEEVEEVRVVEEVKRVKRVKRMCRRVK